MTLDGTYTFPAPRERVWALLMDTDAIASCVRGCERLEPLGGDRYQAKLVATVAAMSGSYEGTVAMLDQVAPASYRLVIEGSGTHGFVNGESRITLRQEGASTIVDVTGTMDVGGTIARLGQRLIGSVSKMMLDRFFACMQGKVPA
ncbi:MAG: carbon monoxide dehydrogenase subunit G [Acidobacteria bacterium]|nr:carbon monoxide dehydrogenase subunit G [Acidobacteriota bacterium]